MCVGSQRRFPESRPCMAPQNASFLRIPGRSLSLSRMQPNRFGAKPSVVAWAWCFLSTCEQTGLAVKEASPSRSASQATTPVPCQPSPDTCSSQNANNGERNAFFLPFSRWDDGSPDSDLFGPEARGSESLERGFGPASAPRRRRVLRSPHLLLMAAEHSRSLLTGTGKKRP